MTMPHLMNCPHDDHGWCLACVKQLNSELDQSQSELAALKQQLESAKWPMPWAQNVKPEDAVIGGDWWAASEWVESHLSLPSKKQWWEDMPNAEKAIVFELLESVVTKAIAGDGGGK